MNGKIKLKLNQKYSFFNNRYEVFVDDDYIGHVDYKNPKIDFVTNFGNHKILVKAKDFEKEHHFVLDSKKIVLPIEINENIFWSKSNENLPKVLQGVLLGFLIVYVLVITFLMTSERIEFKYALLIPFFILLFLKSFGEKNQKFELNFK